MYFALSLGHSSMSEGGSSSNSWTRSVASSRSLASSWAFSPADMSSESFSWSSSLLRPSSSRSSVSCSSSQVTALPPRVLSQGGYPRDGLGERRGSGDHVLERVGEHGGRHEDAALLRRRRRERAHAQSGPRAHERARGDVPRLDAALEVRVVAARRGPHEVERGAAEPAQVPHAGKDARGDGRLRLADLGVVAEARGHERMPE